MFRHTPIVEVLIVSLGLSVLVFKCVFFAPQAESTTSNLTNMQRHVDSNFVRLYDEVRT